MRSITLPLTVLMCFVISCGNHSMESSHKNQQLSLVCRKIPLLNQKKIAGEHTTKWIDSFRAFRDAVYQRLLLVE
jgi:hypothetical protein